MSEHLILTLGQIRKHEPYLNGWRTLLTALGCDLPDGARTIADFDGRFDPDRRVSLGDVAYSNGVADALWCARCLPNTVDVRRAVVGMILPTVKRAAEHTTDARVHGYTADVERWQAGDDTVDLDAAVRAAWAAEAVADAVRAKAADAAAWAEAADAAAWAEAADAAAWAEAADAAAAAAAAWAARAAAAEAAARTAEVAARTAEAAWAAWAAAEAAWAAEAEERARQRVDIIAISPPLAFAQEAT